MFTLALISTGCGKNNEPFKQDGKQNSYTITVKKAEDNSVDYAYQTEKNTITIQELMENLSKDISTPLSFKTARQSNKLSVVELMGVVNTQGKQWKLYLNEEQKEYSNVEGEAINSQTKMEWKYE